MSMTEAMVTTQVYRVYIKATPQAVWDAITRPEWTERYGYRGRVDMELRPGGSITGYTTEAMKAVGAEQGFPVPDVAVDGEVIEADPPRRLVTTFRMLMDEDTKSEGFTRLTYEIDEGQGGVTRLTLTHDLAGAPKLAMLVSGSLEEQGAGGGWSWILSDLKSLLETGTALDESNDLNQG
jgi:uncharacterized protein YndB with AHSA1/START domain